MAQPAIPINQQNALPIQSIAAASSPDQVTINGGQVLKYFSPGSATPPAHGTGINGTPAGTDGNGHVFIASNFLGLSGCSNLVALITRGNSSGVGLGALTAMSLLMQYRLTPITVAPTSNALGGGSINLDQCGMGVIATTSVIFPGMNSGNFEYVALSWGPSVDLGSSTVITPTTIGADLRFILSWSTNAVNVNNLFSLSVWGSS
jgi:hypothetical protein